jgi:hypothetical protein
MRRRVLPSSSLVASHLRTGRRRNRDAPLKEPRISPPEIWCSTSPNATRIMDRLVRDEES